MPTKDLVIAFMNDFTDAQLDVIMTKLVNKANQSWDDEPDLVNQIFRDRLSTINKILLRDSKMFSKHEKAKFICSIDELLHDINTQIAIKQNKLSEDNLGKLKSIVLRHELDIEI